jgi:AraC-like DNA-binding protein
MKVIEFDTAKGLYAFTFDGLVTEWHSHPAAEVLIAHRGVFMLWTDSGEHEGLRFAIVGANVKHKVCADDSDLEILMIEHHTVLLNDWMAEEGITLTNGIYCSKAPLRGRQTIDRLLQGITVNNNKSFYDVRVQTALLYIDQHKPEYNNLVDSVQGVTHLSASRLSHLFKAQVGISLRKYLLWAKIRTAIQQHLHEGDNLFEALIRGGFFDQPHFSRTFKTMLGVNPAKVYNSRTVQVSARIVE